MSRATHAAVVHRALSPVFIMSWVRSGSTLLRFMLDTHPDIACPGEVELGVLCDSLSQTLFPTLALQALAHERRRAVVDEIRRIAGGIMDAYTRARGKLVWCDKSPENVLHIPILESVFPDARFVCLYRDGVDVIHSSVRYRARNKLDELDAYVARTHSELEGAAEGWLDATGRILGLENRRPDACYRVRYEELVREPRDTLSRLLQWLGLANDPTIIERLFVTSHGPGEGDDEVLFSHAIDQRGVGRGRQRGVEVLEQRTRDALAERLATLGYAAHDVSVVPHGAKARVDPSRLEQLLAETMPMRLRENAAMLRSAGSFRFVIPDFTPSVWSLDLRGPKPYLAPVDAPMACTITVDAATLAAILAREDNAASAYLDGLIQVDGDRSHLRVLRFVV